MANLGPFTLYAGSVTTIIDDNHEKEHHSLKLILMDQFQMLTDHARRESVMRYATVWPEAKQRLTEKKVFKLDDNEKTKQGGLV